MTVHPAKTQISLGICPVWSESSLSAWRQLGSLATYWAHSKASDQTGRQSFCWFCHEAAHMFYVAITVWFMIFSLCFFADSIKKNKARFTKHTWPLSLPCFLIDPPGFFQQKKGTEPVSQKIIFCIGNYMHFIAPFWRLVSVMTSITLRNAGMQATWRQIF